MNIKSFGSAAVFTWTRDYLFQVLVGGENPIVTDPQLINALKQIDRGDFIPNTLKSRAYEDSELEIGYGEKLNKPTVVAQMLSYLKPKFGGRYLDVGTGTGYVAALLATIAGQSGKVYTIERVQWLWEQARINMQKYPAIKNVEFLYRDGMEGLIQKAPFDGIHISFAVESVPENLKMQLNQAGGIMIYPTPSMNLKVLERKGLEEFYEEEITGFIFDKGKAGVA